MVVNEVFWLVCCSDFGVEGPHLSVFVQFQNGHEAQIAQIAMPKGTTCEAQDDPKTAALAKTVAWELGYVEAGEEGAAAPTGYMAAQRSWLLFRQAHPNLLSRDVHLANAVYYADLEVKWDEDPQTFEKVCEMVEKLSDQTEKSIDCIVDAMDDLVREGIIDLKSFATDPLFVRDKVAKGYKEVR